MVFRVEEVKGFVTIVILRDSIIVRNYVTSFMHEPSSPTILFDEKKNFWKQKVSNLYRAHHLPPPPSSNGIKI
jgi:hypothetical protein